jgi:ribosomal subunit interface protein
MTEFDINAVQLKIQAPDLSIDDAFHDFILDQISRLGNLFNRIKKCELMLRPESNRKHIMEADIKIYIPGSMLFASGKNTDLRTAVTEAFHDVHEQLHKYKERMKTHHADQVEKLAETDLPDEDANTE